MNDDQRLEQLEKMASQGADIWEAVISEGIEVGRDRDSRSWRLGDLALLVQKQYGRNSIGKFAKEINVPVRRVYDFRRVSKLFPRDIRDDIITRFENLAYTHFEISASLKDQALEFLEAASLNNWTCEEAKLKKASFSGDGTGGGNLPPVKRLEAVGQIVDIQKSPNGAFVGVYFDAGLDLAALMDMLHQEFLFKVYDAIPEATPVALEAAS